jgi:hypothetical protein
MSKQTKRIAGAALLTLITSLGTLALITGRPRNLMGRLEKRPIEQPLKAQGPQAKAPKTNGPGPRNLSLQPEAFNLGRRLGSRFGSGKREKSILVGTLTVGSERRIVHTIRTQTDNGEQVEIKIAGSPGSLTWDAGEGALSSKSRAGTSDRELIERLVLDSPDQFVLAQLRGASYYTVARNVRPANVDDKYSGPLWDIVRVSDPEPDETKRPQSSWRLYYLNTATGLIDKIESEVGGQRIFAEISGWTKQNGENVPTQITWTCQGRTLMQYALTNFSHGENV